MGLIAPLTLIHLGLLSVCLAQTPPATWKEHWFEHVQDLKRVFFNDDVAIYFDNNVDPTITWVNNFVTDAWRYTKRVYGNFGTENRLYAVFHTNTYSGGHPDAYYSANHDYRNVIDCGPYSWKNGDGPELDMILHEIMHIVESASKNTAGSPQFKIWGDSKWAEIFIYDAYRNLNKATDAKRAYDQFVVTQDTYPRANTFWFRDWFYPIYSNYGESAVLNRYFELLAQYFPKNGIQYNRDMNFGEFIHFWSGAAGANLKTQATKAFGWTNEYETQFIQAQKTFPFPYTVGVARFYQNCQTTGYFASLPVGQYSLSDMRKKGLQNDDISSVVINPGYQVVIYENDGYTGSPTVLLAGTYGCLADYGWGDRISSLIVRIAQ